MLHSSVVAALAQASLSGASAIALFRAATSPAARWLSSVLALIAAYNVAIGLGYALHPERPLPALALFQLCLLFGYASSVTFSGFLWARFRGAQVHPTAAATVIAPVAAVFCLGLYDLVTRGETHDWAYDVLAVLLCVAQASSVALAVAIRRGLDTRAARALRGYLVVTLLALLPIVLDVVNVLWVPVPGYRVVRNLAAMAVIYGMLAAFLNDNVQVVSLRLRALGGILAIALSTVVVAAELVTAPRGTVEAHETSLKLVSLVAGLVLVVPLLVNALYRKSFIRPLEHLVEAVTKADGAHHVALPVDLRDEIGVLTESFNRTMTRLSSAHEELEARLRELSARNREVLELNQELRFQLEARSRDLATFSHSQITTLECKPGDEVGSRYRVLDLLGRGGMGAVYRVARIRDGRQLALKLILEPNPEAALRFAREAEVAIRLTGPHLVSVVDVGVTDGRPFLVMELIPGGALEDQRARFGSDQRWALCMLLHIARGLQTIHEAGVMHRDLKPANVLLLAADDHQVAKIADFGIAKEQVDGFAATLAVGAGPRRPTGITASGAIIGTVDYMAPELAVRGAAPSGAVDIFAFGLIAWELLSGSRPFQAPALYFALANVPLPPPTPLPSSITGAGRDVLYRCVAAVPSERPTARELVRVLETWVTRTDHAR